MTNTASDNIPQPIIEQQYPTHKALLDIEWFLVTLSYTMPAKLGACLELK